MSGANFSSKPTVTDRRIADLETYLSENVLSSAGFVCQRAAQCKASHSGQFYEGQLHHVGRHYDLCRDGQPFRIVVVGQEYGHNPVHVSLAHRRDMVLVETGLERRFVSEDGYTRRNPHMVGTTNLLRLCFELGLGVDHAGEFLDLDGERVHIFDAFALVNYLLCSAAPPEAPPPAKTLDMKTFSGAYKGRATAAMRRNCADHFKRTLEILEPTLIVIQGLNLRKWIAPVLGIAHEPSSTVEIVRIGVGSPKLISLTHPSARDHRSWGRGERGAYLLEVVKPAVETALGEASNYQPELPLKPSVSEVGDENPQP